MTLRDRTGSHLISNVRHSRRSESVQSMALRCAGSDCGGRSHSETSTSAICASCGGDWHILVHTTQVFSLGLHTPLRPVRHCSGLRHGVRMGDWLYHTDVSSLHCDEGDCDVDQIHTSHLAGFTMRKPNQRIEANRHRSARFGLAWEGSPIHHSLEWIEGRSPHPRRSVMGKDDWTTGG